MEVIPRIPETSADLGRVREIRDYASAHLPAAAARSVDSAVSEIELNARVRAQVLPQMDAWLGAAHR
jgi:hypothetical protein